MRASTARWSGSSSTVFNPHRTCAVRDDDGRPAVVERPSCQLPPGGRYRRTLWTSDPVTGRCATGREDGRITDFLELSRRAQSRRAFAGYEVRYVVHPVPYPGDIRNVGNPYPIRLS